jgi:hypothetical protein
VFAAICGVMFRTDRLGIHVEAALSAIRHDRQNQRDRYGYKTLRSGHDGLLPRTGLGVKRRSVLSAMTSPITTEFLSVPLTFPRYCQQTESRGLHSAVLGINRVLLPVHFGLSAINHALPADSAIVHSQNTLAAHHAEMLRIKNELMDSILEV